MKVLNYFLLVVFALTLSSCKYFKKKKMYSKNIDTLLTQPVMVDTTPVDDTIEIETIVQETEPVDINKNTGIGYTSDSYYMIVGSFLSEQLAKKYAETIKDMGYQPQVIYSSYTGFYRVSAQSYDNLQTALNEMPEFRSSVTNRAWVHVKK